MTDGADPASGTVGYALLTQALDGNGAGGFGLMGVGLVMLVGAADNKSQSSMTAHGRKRTFSNRPLTTQNGR